jgi:cell division initiation protein
VPLTPLEIKKKTFSSQLRGFSTAEVKAFLEQIATESEDLRRERGELAEKVETLTAQLAAYAKTENLVKETLLTAQKATGELRQDAERKAELIIGQARLEAEGIRKKVQDELESAKTQLAELDVRRTHIIDEVTGIARAYLSLSERLQNRKTDAEKEAGGKRPGSTG